MINENQLIQQLSTQSAQYIGDDAAVLPLFDEQKLVVSKDLLIEDIHFRTRYFSPHDLAHKALEVNLSDLAAMGAEPCHVLCGISIPPQHQDYALAFLPALQKSCDQRNVSLIGGDTTASPDKLVLSLTVLGKAYGQNIKYRSTNRVGDILCVIGNIGYAYRGFMDLEQNSNSSSRYTTAFLRPNAKVEEGLWLAKQNAVTSMMDVSDGLMVDCQRLCRSAKQGAVIDLDCVNDYLTTDISLPKALAGGEDYSLLVTIDAELFIPTARQFQQRFGFDLKKIGKIVAGDQVLFTQNGQFTSLDVQPFSHFGESYEA